MLHLPPILGHWSVHSGLFHPLGCLFPCMEEHPHWAGRPTCSSRLSLANRPTLCPPPLTGRHGVLAGLPTKEPAWSSTSTRRSVDLHHVAFLLHQPCPFFRWVLHSQRFSPYASSQASERIAQNLLSLRSDTTRQFFKNLRGISKAVVENEGVVSPNPLGI